MTVVRIQAIGTNGRTGIHHRLWISEPRWARRIKVVATCEHGDADRVFAVCSGFNLRCDWTAGVLEALLRRGTSRGEAYEWASLPILPTYIRRHARRKPSQLSLCQVYRFQAVHVSPLAVARDRILGHELTSVW
jgi:hypothetical protein